MKRENVYKAIDSERDYQDVFWGEEGKSHEIDAWVLYIVEYSQRLMTHASDPRIRRKTGDSVQDIARKVAALCVALMEEHGVRYRNDSPIIED